MKKNTDKLTKIKALLGEALTIIIILIILGGTYQMGYSTGHSKGFNHGAFYVLGKMSEEARYWNDQTKIRIDPWWTANWSTCHSPAKDWEFMAGKTEEGD